VNNKLAILVPVYNGGALLRQTVESCALATLAPERYELIVVDNCSTDGSFEALPQRLSNGAAVQVHRNEQNLGRIGNWNRGLEIATDQGFTYAAFLFVGDEWLQDGSIAPLLNAMDESSSVLGMASLRIVDEEGADIRAGARVSIKGLASNIVSSDMLRQSIHTGRLPFAPIQANVYRIFKDRPLRFDTSAEKSLNADIEATALFLQEHPGTITVFSKPFLIWRERRGRFFTSQDPWFVFEETRRSLQRLSDVLKVPVDWKSANAIAMLAAIRETSQMIAWRKRTDFQLRVFRFLLAHEAGLSLVTMCRFVIKKLVSRESYLVLTHNPELPAPSQVFQTMADQCRL
jgi:glycosyltransferase involved in cell wall biosynthesis